MIEKKTMGYADFGCPQYEAKAVAVMADTESGEVVIYKPDEDDETEWLEPYYDQEHFFPTVEEAQQALEQHRRELREMMPKVQQWVEQMDHLREGMKEKPEDADDDEWRKAHPEWFSREDYLPYRYSSSGGSFWRKESDRLENERNLLLQVIRTGFVSIRGNQVRIGDVESVRWGENRAELTLKGGRTVETAKDYEKNVVGYLFGQNVSGYTYTRLNRKEEDGDEG